MGERCEATGAPTWGPDLPSHLLLSKVLLVELQRVKLDGELAWVPHHHCPLSPTAVRQQRSQFKHQGAELQLWLQPTARDLQLEVLAALANVNLQLASVGLLKREKCRKLLHEVPGDRASNSTLAPRSVPLR